MTAAHNAAGHNAPHNAEVGVTRDADAGVTHNARSRAARRRAAKVAERRERRRAKAALAEQTKRRQPVLLHPEVLPDLLGLPRVGGDW